MRRREFIALVGGTAAACPFAARAQQPGQMRRIGVLMSVEADDPLGQVRLKSFLEGLRMRGWIEGKNVRVDTCWGGGKAERYRTCAGELIGLAPDVILAEATSTLRWRIV